MGQIRNGKRMEDLVIKVGFIVVVVCWCNIDMEENRHSAVDPLVNLFLKANHDISLINRKLQKEFSQVYPDTANPMMLVARLKKLQNDVMHLKEDCGMILTAKQNLIDMAKSTLLGSAKLMKGMEMSLGVSHTGDSNRSAVADLTQVIDEWTSQVESCYGGLEENEPTPEDINQLLFHAP